MNSKRLCITNTEGCETYSVLIKLCGYTARIHKKWQNTITKKYFQKYHFKDATKKDLQT